MATRKTTKALSESEPKKKAPTKPKTVAKKPEEKPHVEAAPPIEPFAQVEEPAVAWLREHLRLVLKSGARLRITLPAREPGDAIQIWEYEVKP